MGGGSAVPFEASVSVSSGTTAAIYTFNEPVIVMFTVTKTVSGTTGTNISLPFTQWYLIDASYCADGASTSASAYDYEDCRKYQASYNDSPSKWLIRRDVNTYGESGVSKNTSCIAISKPGQSSYSIQGSAGTTSKTFSISGYYIPLS